MKKDMKKEIEKLLNSDINSNKLSKLSGVDQPTIHRIRNGTSKLGNISFDKALKLFNLTEEMDKMENNKVIVWTGKTTDGNKKWTAKAPTYKELFETLIDKYEYAIVDYDKLGIKKLEVNGEDLDKYDVTTDGIGNWELFEEFENRKDLKELSDEDYKDVIRSSDGSAYYQDFEVRYYFEAYDTEYVEEFDTDDFQMEEDEDGWYATDKDEYLWIVRFNKAIEKLKENDVDVEALEFNEYEDYITEANKY
ncbi:hypothetical protein [Macrococcus capreoli]|uniref:hypothetical protein n=1 Tax=Macrococcus capreoli TaxID=2982690 RepID=UPI003F4334D6